MEPNEIVKQMAEISKSANKNTKPVIHEKACPFLGITHMANQQVAANQCLKQGCKFWIMPQSEEDSDCMVLEGLESANLLAQIIAGFAENFQQQIEAFTKMQQGQPPEEKDGIEETIG